MTEGVGAYIAISLSYKEGFDSVGKSNLMVTTRRVVECTTMTVSLLIHSKGGMQSRKAVTEEIRLDASANY